MKFYKYIFAGTIGKQSESWGEPGGKNTLHKDMLNQKHREYK